MTDQPETARHLLDRYGLPEDVIDGVLCLHAQELAAVQRRDAAVWGVDTAAGKHILAAADLIDPTRAAAAPAPVPPVDRAAPVHAFRVSEIRDNTVRRVHGYHASLKGAFTYCETQERTPSTIESARFELFPTPGGEQWMVHAYYGPGDPCPEISDLVIRQVDIIQDGPGADAMLGMLPSPTDRAACDCDAEVHMGAGFYHQPHCATRQGTAPADRAAVLREAADVAAQWNSDCQSCAVELEVATELRRMAAEAQQDGAQS